VNWERFHFSFLRKIFGFSSLLFLFSFAVPIQAQQAHYLKMLDRALRSRSAASFQFRTLTSGPTTEIELKKHPQMVQVSFKNGGESRPAPSSTVDIIIQEYEQPLDLTGARGIELEADIPENDLLTIELLPEESSSYGGCGDDVKGIGLARYIIIFSNLKKCWNEGGLDPSRISVIRISNRVPNQKSTIQIRGIGLKLPD